MTLLIHGFRDARHSEWVRDFVAIMDEMKRYVLEKHPTGLVWNPSVSYMLFRVRRDSELCHREFMFQNTNLLHRQVPLHPLRPHSRPRLRRHLAHHQHQQEEASLLCSPS